jgi:hypothetical protein
LETNKLGIELEALADLMIVISLASTKGFWTVLGLSNYEEESAELSLVRRLHSLVEDTVRTDQFCKSKQPTVVNCLIGLNQRPATMQQLLE